MKRALFLAVLLAASAGAQTAAKRKHPAKAKRAAKKTATAAPATAPAAAPAKTVPAPAAEPAPPAPPAPPRDEAALATLGAALLEDSDGLLAAEPWPKGAADQMGLRPGDRVLYSDRGETRTRAEAAAARRQAAPEERESLVLRRGLLALALSGTDVPAPADFVRGARDLSSREKALAAGRADKARSAAADAVAASAPLEWSLRADQAFWVRFPDGLPAGLKKGDVVAAEASTGLTTDGSLDFLAVPPGSKYWARVVDASDDGAVRAMRLAFFKLAPAGGHAYAALGSATALSGASSQETARVSPGGTLAVAAPLPPADGRKPRGKDLLLGPDARLRVRLLEPATIAEPPSWWRAGPGLWLKTVEKDGKRRFQITHVVAGRAGAAAGIQVGDLLDAVGGKSSERLDFEEALDALYGAPGSEVKVSVLRGGQPLVLALKRGVKTDKGGASFPLPLPFETR